MAYPLLWMLLLLRHLVVGVPIEVKRPSRTGTPRGLYIQGDPPTSELDHAVGRGQELTETLIRAIRNGARLEPEPIDALKFDPKETSEWHESSYRSYPLFSSTGFSESRTYRVVKAIEDSDPVDKSVYKILISPDSGHCLIQMAHRAGRSKVHFSAVMAYAWFKKVKAYPIGKPISILVPSIVNPTTSNIMEIVYEKMGIPGGREHNWTPGSAGYFALLGTPFGKAIMYALLANSTHSMFVTQILSIYNPHGQDVLLFKLGKVESKHFGRFDPRQRRKK